MMPTMKSAKLATSFYKTLMNKLFLYIFCTFSGSFLYAQNYSITGMVADSSDRKAMPGAVVSLKQFQNPDFRKNQIAENDGSFRFEGLSAGNYQLTVSFIGYNNKEIRVSIPKSNGQLGRIYLSAEGQMLNEFVVKEQHRTVEQRDDTVSFNSKAYKTNPDANAEDLVKKMPGIELSGGQVKAQGEEVRRILVDGKPFFGDDPNIALKNLPANMIDRVEVFDQESDQSRFTGFSDGNASRTLNFITKPGMKRGQFGKFFFGYGTDGRYNGGLTYNNFKGNRRITVLGLTNNINQQNFSTQDLVSMMGGGRSGGGGGGPGSGWGMGGISNFIVGSQDGITASNALGINYSNQWGKISEFTAGYFYNFSRNQNDQQVLRSIFLEEDSLQFYSSQNRLRNDNANHRFNLRMKWDIDSMNSVIYTPSLNYQGAERNSKFNSINFLSGDRFLNESENINVLNNNALMLTNNLLLQHKFSKQGRTISLNGSLEQNFRTGESGLNAGNTFWPSDGSPAITQALDQLAGTSYSGRNSELNLTYTEPLGKKGQLQFSAIHNQRLTLNDQKTNNLDSNEVYNLLDTALSNVFENTYTTYRLGTGYRYNTESLNAMIGVNAQHAILLNEQEFPYPDTLTRTFRNILPYGFVRYRISKTKQFRMFYRSSTNAPSVTQLQGVLNNSNPLQMFIGNPDLKQEFSNFLVARYSSSNTAKSTSFSAFIRVRNTFNYLANANTIATDGDLVVREIVLRRGASLTSPVNMNGYWSNTGNASFGFPVKKLKSNLNLSSSFNFQRIPGMVNGLENLSRNLALSQGLTLSSNISERIDFTISYTGNYNIVQNSLQPQLNSNFYSHNAGMTGNFWIGKKLILRNELNHSLYSGLSEGFNQNFILWNMSVAQKILPKNQAEIRFTAFDILGQNQSIQRFITETHIEDVQNSILSRYFMLSLTYNLSAFNAPKEEELSDEMKMRLERHGLKP